MSEAEVLTRPRKVACRVGGTKLLFTVEVEGHSPEELRELVLKDYPAANPILVEVGRE